MSIEHLAFPNGYPFVKGVSNDTQIYTAMLYAGSLTTSLPVGRHEITEAEAYGNSYNHIVEVNPDGTGVYTAVPTKKALKDDRSAKPHTENMSGRPNLIAIIGAHEQYPDRPVLYHVLYYKPQNNRRRSV